MMRCAPGLTVVSAFVGVVVLAKMSSSTHDSTFCLVGEPASLTMIGMWTGAAGGAAADSGKFIKWSVILAIQQEKPSIKNWAQGLGKPYLEHHPQFSGQPCRPLEPPLTPARGYEV